MDEKYVAKLSVTRIRMVAFYFIVPFCKPLVFLW